MSVENLNPNGPTGGDTINKATQAAHETVDKMAAAASSAQDRTAKAYTSFEQSLRDCTKDRPIQSLLWAIGIGFVLGRLIR